MRSHLLLIFFLGSFVLSNQSFGQQGYCRQNGGFTVTPAIGGCLPLTVTVSNTVGGADPDAMTYYYGYVKGSNTLTGGTNITTSTFQIPGVRTILQSGSVNGTRFFQCEDVIVYESGLITANYSSCGGGIVKLALTDDAFLNVYDQVEIKWGDGETDTWKKGDALNLDHTYASVTGSPTITVQGVYTTNTACKGGKVLSLPVSFLQPQLNAVEIKSLEMKGNGSLETNYFGVTSISTQIQYSSNNGGTYTTAATRSGGGTQFYRTENLNPTQIYQLRLVSNDLCGGSRESQVVTSMVLTGSSNDEKNTISWNKYPTANDFEGYELLRDGVSIKTFSGIGEISYVDEDVQCGDNFEYQVIAKTSKVTSTSAPLSVETKIDQPKPIQQGTVTVNGDNAVVINAVIPGAGGKNNYTLVIEKADAGSTTFKRLITLDSQNEYLDQAVKTAEQSYCYRMSYTNSCGQKLPVSAPICTILLSSQQLPTLNWSTEKPILDDVDSYYVLQNSSSGNVEQAVQLSNTYTPKFNSKSDLEYSFQIRANSKDGAFQSFSNIISINRNASVFIPDAFSPDGDGMNDIFEAKANLLKSFKLSVFNRWGEVVFQSDDIAKGWDGMINGVNAPTGSYVYKLTVTDIIDQNVEKKGTFMLFR